MNDTRGVIERVGERYALPNDAFDRMLRRRDRKRRNQRVAAATVAFAVFVAALAFVLGGNPFDRSERPAVPVPPSASNGDLTYVGADVIDFSDNLSDFGILFLIDPAGGEPRKILAGCPSSPGETTPCEGVGFGSVDWSPDGTRIAYELDGFPRTQSELEGIYVMEVATERVHQLTSCTDPCVVQREVDWSPDGSRIAFSQADFSGCDLADPIDGTCSSLYTMKPDGTDQVKLPTGSVVDPVDPSWSPDGASIAFSARVGEDWFVYTMALDGSEPTQLAADLPSPEQTQPAWSPDGSTIAFVAWEGAAVGAEPTQLDMSMGLPFKLWAMAPDGSERRLLTEGCCFIGGAGYGVQGPEWSPDGTQIALMEGTGGSVRVIDADTGEYVSLPGRPTGPIAWQPVPLTQRP